MVAVSQPWWGCPGHGVPALAVVSMPWPCTLQLCTASPLSAARMGHRSRGSMGEQQLGGGCRVTWGVPSSQLGILPGSVFPMLLEAQAPQPLFPRWGRRHPLPSLTPELTCTAPVRSPLPRAAFWRTCGPSPAGQVGFIPSDLRVVLCWCSGPGLGREHHVPPGAPRGPCGDGVTRSWSCSAAGTDTGVCPVSNPPVSWHSCRARACVRALCSCPRRAQSVQNIAKTLVSLPYIFVSTITILPWEEKCLVFR